MANKYGYMATIGADTSGIREALKDVEAEAKGITAELKAVNEGLKLDGGDNTENLKAKWDLLAKAIENTQSKLNSLKEAEEKVNAAAASGKISSEQQKKHTEEIRKTESQLRVYEQQLKNTQNQLNKNGKSTEDLTAETKQLDKSVDDAGKSAVTFGDIFKANILSDAIMSGVRRLTSEIGDFVKKGIELASSLTEVQNVVDTTFGDEAEVINQWAQQAAGAFGMSELSAKQYTGTLGAMMKSQGITNDKIVEMSESLVGLAGDMASFYNLDIATAFEKIRSGISGETEPLKQLGINMNVTNMEAYALSQGIEKTWRTMSQSEQTQLRYAYLMQQTADAQGDFVRTQDSYANQQRLMQLNMENLEAELGEKLLPIINRITTEVTSELPSLTDNIDKVGDVLAAVTEFAIEHKEVILGLTGAYVAFKGAVSAGTAIEKGITLFGKLKSAIKAATAAQEGLNVAASINPYVLLAGAIAAVTVGLIVLANTGSDTAEKLMNHAEEAKKNYEEQKQKISDLNAELENTKAKIKEIQGRGKLTLTEETELTRLEQQNGLLEGQLEIEKELLETKRQQAQITAIAALYTDDNDSDGSIAKVKKHLDEYKKVLSDYSTGVKYWQDQIDEAIAKGDTAAESMAAENLKQVEKDRNKALVDSKSDLLGAMQELNAFSAGLDLTTTEGIKATNAISALNDEILNLFGLSAGDKTSTSVDNAADYYENIGKAQISDVKKSVEISNGIMADYYKKQGEKQAQNNKSYLEAQKEDEKKLTDELAKIKDRYDRHMITDEGGEQDEVKYYQQRKELLEEYTGERTAVWWKYYDEIATFEKKKADETQKLSDETAKKADEALENELNDIKEKYDRHLITDDEGNRDEDEYYRQRLELLINHTGERTAVWWKYYDEIAAYEKDKRDEAKKEALEDYEDSAKELSEAAKKGYAELKSEKERAKNELSSVDLMNEVETDKGEKVNILTDLNAEKEKLQKYTADIARLKAAGAKDSLIAEIESMNYESGDRQAFVDALLGLNGNEWELYKRDWDALQKEQEAAAQAQISDDLQSLNGDTRDAVAKIYSDMPAAAYEEGVTTAQSYIQGIKDSMQGVESDANILSITSRQNANAGLLSTADFIATLKELNLVSGNSPVTINLNDKDFIKTTINKLVNAGKLTGKNVLNL